MYKLVISSTGPGADSGWGDYMGQYQCDGRLNGAPYYVQTGKWYASNPYQGDRHYLYRDPSKAWRAGTRLGPLDEYCVFYHPPTTEDTPPLAGWQYYDEDGELHDDPSLVITIGSLSIPRSIRIQSTGGVAAINPDCLGTFIPTKRWSLGRPVFSQLFRNEEGAQLYYYDGRWRGVYNDGEEFAHKDTSTRMWPTKAAGWEYWDTLGHVWRDADIAATATITIPSLSDMCVTKVATHLESKMELVKQLEIPGVLKQKISAAIETLQAEWSDDEVRIGRIIYQINF